jgi:hypothetical protein
MGLSKSSHCWRIPDELWAKYNLSYPQASRTHWGVIAHEWMIAKRWMRFSIVYEQDVNGKRPLAKRKPVPIRLIEPNEE